MQDKLHITRDAKTAAPLWFWHPCWLTLAGHLIFEYKWYICYTMQSFEFDARKSASNKTKHGVDFVEAQALWLDPGLIEIPALTDDEPRFLVIGKLLEKHWSAVVTYRDGNIRLISVRRSRTEEIEIYES